MSGWTEARVDELKRRWKAGERPNQIARAMAVTRNSIIGKSRVLGLHFRPIRHSVQPRFSTAAAEGRTRYKANVHDVGSARILKPGAYQRKLGSVVGKGRWKGFPIYSLTLEERATCPRSCAVWEICYGNNSHNAIRYRHGPELETRIVKEIACLNAAHPDGFVVRLHILGDFYSIDYVALWARLLKLFPALHIFGYSAWQRGTPIGDAVANLRDRHWARFAIRTSGGPNYLPRTVVVQSPKEARNVYAIICPAQTAKSQNCGSCGLCWSPAAKKRTIAFLQH